MSFPHFVEANDNGRTMELAAEPRGDDADHAVVPSVATDDEGAVAFGIENFADLFQGRLKDFLLEFLALAIARIEFARQSPRLTCVLGEQQFQRRLRRIEAPRCVESRAQAESHVPRGNRRHDRADFHERAKTDPFCLAQARESVSHENAVLAAQRRQVADDAHGNEIEIIAQIGFPSPCHFLDRVTKFENKRRGAEIGVSAEGLRVDHRRALGGLFLRFVVVDDDQLDALLREPRRLLL